jgi:oligopeptide transport system permease protein
MSEKTVDGPKADNDVLIQESPETAAEAQEKQERVGNIWTDAWLDLRKNPFFIISGVLIVFLLVVAIFPGWFTDINPYSAKSSDLSNSLVAPSGDHWFGFDLQGRDIYARTVYATRNSIVVGVLTSAIVGLVGSLMGMAAGLAGGWVDALLSRITDIFFALPLLIAGLLVLSMFHIGNVWSVSLVMAAFGWPQIYRIMRGTVMANKNNDYVMAARALGAGSSRMAFRHVLPNAIAPVIVIMTINLGVYISAEASLSYLGIGIQPPDISWGLMISEAQERFLQAPHALLFPAGALSLTVLAFVMLGDAVRDALDPKTR